MQKQLLESKKEIQRRTRHFWSTGCKKELCNCVNSLGIPKSPTESAGNSRIIQ